MAAPHLSYEVKLALTRRRATVTLLVLSTVVAEMNEQERLKKRNGGKVPTPHSEL